MLENGVIQTINCKLFCTPRENKEIMVKKLKYFLERVGNVCKGIVN